METVKAKGDWELEVLGVPFGSPDDRDSDGQFFNADTNLHTDKIATPPAVYYHGRSPEGRPIDPEYIGSSKYLRTDEKGVWYSVILDKTKQLAQRVWEAAKDGIARASSGSAPHLVRYGENGHIREWPVFELSVFDAEGKRQPSNKHAVAMPVMKAIYKEAGIELPSDDQPYTPLSAADIETETTKNKQENFAMDEKDVEVKIAAALKAEREAVQAANEAAKARQAEIEAEAEKKANEKLEAYKAEAAKGRRLPDYDGVAPYATKFNDSKFDNASPEDLSLSIEVLRAHGKRPSELAIKSLAYKILSEKEQNSYVKGAMKAAGLVDEASVKAAEVMATSDSGNGSDWIGTAYSNQLWRSIRHDGGIVSKIPEAIIPDGYSSQYFPLEDADPTWYNVAEATAETSGRPDVTVTSSKASTGTKQLTVKKAGARTVYTGELTEDSIVAFAPQLREQMSISGREMMENVLINGDTDGANTTNINFIDGDPGGTEIYTLLDGFRKLALVTNTANSRSAGGALAIEDYLETMRLMGTAGLNAGDPSKVFFIVDPNVHYANMSLPEVKTRDVFSSATIENGFLTRAYGVQIMPSWQMHATSTARKANTSGKVLITTQATNTTGAILCVRPDQWKLGYKRRMTIELSRFPESDTWQIVALARFGLAYRDTEASAISYNVGV